MTSCMVCRSMLLNPDYTQNHPIGYRYVEPCLTCPQGRVRTTTVQDRGGRALPPGFTRFPLLPRASALGSTIARQRCVRTSVVPTGLAPFSDLQPRHSRAGLLSAAPPGLVLLCIWCVAWPRVYSGSTIPVSSFVPSGLGWIALICTQALSPGLHSWAASRLQQP